MISELYFSNLIKSNQSLFTCPSKLKRRTYRNASIAFLPVDSTRIALATADILWKIETRIHPHNIILTLNYISIFPQSKDK